MDIDWGTLEAIRENAKTLLGYINRGLLTLEEAVRLQCEFQRRISQS